MIRVPKKISSFSLPTFQITFPSRSSCVQSFNSFSSSSLSPPSFLPIRSNPIQSLGITALMVFISMLQLAFSPTHLLSNFITFFLLISALHFTQRSLGGVGSENERTLAIIKPDGLFGNYTSLIKEIILDSGFTIAREMTIQLDEDSAKSFYVEHFSKSFFPSLVNYMTSGPVLIMVLEKVNAVSDWRALIGPTDAKNAKVTHPKSIRAMCGTDLTSNCVHGSDSLKSAAREISFFFTETSPGGFVSYHDEL